MSSRTTRFSLLSALLGLVLSACGGDPPPADGGRIEHDASGDDAATDGGPADAGDTTAPTVIATSPIDGATLVPADTAITIAFSEAIAETSGTITAADDAAAVALGAPSWNDEATSVTLTPTAPLRAGATISVTIADVEDLAGNALTAPVTFTFEVEDAVAPTIVRTTPTDDASDVDPTLAAIEIEFGEPMRVASGTARISGPGAPSLGEITWMDRVATIPVSALRADATYRVELEGFEDAAGNALDASALGSDVALSFTTGPDLVAPVVVASTPREGQLDVDTGLITQVAIEFSEAMDTTVGTFALEIDGVTTALTARWDRGGTRVLLGVAGRLAAAAAHRVTIDGLQDLAGNALDGATYLVDGALDFTTGADLFVPFVAFTSPEEGATGVAGGVLEIVVVFSEAMDASITTAPLTGDGRTVTLSGTWSSGNTVLTLDAPMLQAGRSYDLDLQGFRDLGGTLVEATHPYLEDGIASFALAAPRGERCGDALTELEATASGGSYTWTIASGSVAANDGSASCDPDGHGADALVRVRKTTPPASDGGTVLHVVVTGTTSGQNFDVDVLAGDCRTAASSTDASRQRCLVERNAWEQWLDVGPGDYFVWVARDGSATFTGATVTIEELPAAREGESCTAPLSTATASPLYTAPAAPGEPHRWVIPDGYANAMDRGITASDPAGAVSCMPAGSSRGHDAVLQYVKASDTSLITMRMTTTSSRYGAIEVVRGCDPTDPTRSEIACVPYVSSAVSREMTFGGAAGPISAWIVDRRSAPLPAGGWSEGPAATIEITEFEPGPGDTCATAIPLTAGTTNTVTATRPWRADVPACLATGGVTWFRYTPTQGLGILRTNGASVGAVVDRATGRLIRCQGDDTAAGLPVFGLPGQEVCLALSSTSGVSQITIDEMPYSGVRGIETELFVTPPDPIPPSTIPPSLGTSGWWARQGDRIFTGRFRGIFSAPIAGNVQSTFVSTDPFSCRYAGMARPDGLYCVSETTGATTPRLYRVVDAAGNVLATPEPVDVLPTGFSYVAQRFDGLAFDGTQYVLASIGTTSGDGTTSFYSVPATGGAPTLLGTSNLIDGLGAIALDADYLYVSGRSTGVLGIWRLRRDQLSNPDQVPVQLVDGYLLSNFGGGALAVDSTVSAHALYFRQLASGGPSADILLVLDPRADAPRWIGPLWRAPGTRQDNGFGLDTVGPTMWFLHTNGTGGTSGRWVRLD